MQGQRSSVSLPEILEFDLRSSSSTVGMDQDNFWNSMVLHPAETQNLPNYLLSPSDTDMSYVNMSTGAGSSSSIWNSGASSSAGHSLDMGDHGETKTELVLPASPIGGGPIEAGNMLSLDDVDINVSSTHIDDGQSFPFALDSNLNEPQNLEHNVGDEVSESELFSHPYVPSLLERDHGPPNLFSSNSYGSSSGAVGFMSGDYGNKPGSSLDGRRLACKRKNIEGLPGQSSASGSANFFQTSESNPVHSVSVRRNANPSIHIASPSSYIPGASSSREQPNLRFSNITRGTALNSYPASSVARNPESSQRNFRSRICPAHQHDVYPPNLSSSRDTAQNSSIWLPNEPSSNFIPLNQRLETRPVASGSRSQNQPHASVIPGLPRHVNPYPRNAIPNSRNGSLSNFVNSTDTLAAIRDDTVSRNTLRNDVSAHSSLFPTTEIRNSSQDLNWNVASGSGGMAGVVAPTARAGLSSGVHSSLGPTWTLHQNPPAQISRSLVEAVHRTLLASVGSESRGQSSNFVSQRPGQSSPVQEVGHQSGSVSRGNQQSHMRTALLMDMHSDNLSTLAFRESRSRIMSEIRNALDLMHRGERFEDVFMLDHPAFHGAADVRDRHRDMRLDVDNMSYEELLALEERIGTVSTGLCEETILKCLKQRKHFSIGVRSTAEAEPCCICQEEYVEGEDLGTLDCGHDFHTACIKQWLSQKNLCPICKTTGLVT